MPQNCLDCIFWLNSLNNPPILLKNFTRAQTHSWPCYKERKKETPIKIFNSQTHRQHRHTPCLLKRKRLPSKNSIHNITILFSRGEECILSSGDNSLLKNPEKFSRYLEDNIWFGHRLTDLLNNISTKSCSEICPLHCINVSNWLKLSRF